MNLIIMGPQGSGKSTQAKILSEKLAIPVISGGEVSAKIAAENPAIKRIFDSGKLIPDEILNEAIARTLQNPEVQNGFILDGYPRHRPQLDFLLNFLFKNDRKIDRAIYIKLSEDEAVKRIMVRIQTEHRSDDTPEAIKQRFDIFYNETTPMINYWQQDGTLSEIDGQGSIEEVSLLVAKALGLSNSSA